MTQYLTSRIGMRDMVIDPLQSHIGGDHPSGASLEAESLPESSYLLLTTQL